MPWRTSERPHRWPPPEEDGQEKCRNPCRRRHITVGHELTVCQTRKARSITISNACTNVKPIPEHQGNYEKLRNYAHFFNSMRTVPLTH